MAQRKKIKPFFCYTINFVNQHDFSRIAAMRILVILSGSPWRRLPPDVKKFFGMGIYRIVFL
ncbi:MAG: hypothetical protein WC745_00040 [Patescibacteria group bacterium]|jgi:hypothetical protein